MNRSVRNGASLFFLASAAAALALVVACSSSDEAAPTRTLTPAPSSTATTDAAVPDGGEAPDANACFEGEPSTITDFLNACSDGQCAPFDNAARLPLFKPGQPLPPIP